AVNAAEEEKPKPAAPAIVDADLARFIASKRRLVEKLDQELKPGTAKDVWKFFDAAAAGNASATSNLIMTLSEFKGLQPGADGEPPPASSSSSSEKEKPLPNPVIWPIAVEVNGVIQVFARWDHKLLHRFGEDIIRSIPTNSIYFGGTDSGR